MKRHLIISLSLLFLVNIVFAQKQNFATNYQSRVEVTPEKIVIKFTNTGTDRTSKYEISLVFSDKSIVPRTVVGTGIKDFMEETKITWYYKTDGYDYDKISNSSFSVQATCLSCGGGGSGVKNPCKVAGIPPWAGLGGTVLTGGSLVVTGLIKMGKSKTSRDEYAVLDASDRNNYLIDNYPDIENSDDLYSELNGDYKQGQWLAYGGGTILLVGGYVFVRRLIDCNRMKNRMTSNTRFKVEPQIEFADVAGYDGTFAGGATVGVRLGYSF